MVGLFHVYCHDPSDLTADSDTFAELQQSFEFIRARFRQKRQIARSPDQQSHSRGLSTRGRGTYTEDKLLVFMLADRGSGERYVIPAKTADESTIRLLLVDRQQESLTRRGLSPYRGVSKGRLTPYLRAFPLRRDIFRKTGKEALKTIIETAL